MKRIISLLLLSLLILLCVGCDTSTPEVKDGATPYIQDGYWYIDGVNTQIRTEGLLRSDYGRKWLYTDRSGRHGISAYLRTVRHCSHRGFFDH